MFLRMLNDLLKRLSPCTQAAFAGEIQSLIALVFPLTARSGVNLKGEYNVENVTRFETVAAADVTGETWFDQNLEKLTLADIMEGGKPTAQFYTCFWSLQDCFRNPPALSSSKEDYDRFKRRLNCSIAIFKELYAQDSRTHGNGGTAAGLNVLNLSNAQSAKDVGYVPKYLTSLNLFKLQLSDLTFRRSFLLQCLITLRFLQQANTADSTGPSPIAASEEWRIAEVPWFQETISGILAILERSKPHGLSFVNSVNCIMEMEMHWASKCIN